MGSQNVAIRNRSTAVIAWWAGMPMAVSPAAMTASTPPSPPGVGVADPTALPARNTTAVARMAGCAPTDHTVAMSAREYAAESSRFAPEGMGDRVKQPRPDLTQVRPHGAGHLLAGLRHRQHHDDRDGGDR